MSPALAIAQTADVLDLTAARSGPDTTSRSTDSGSGSGLGSETLTFPVATLYGSTLSPGTLKTIRPGDSVEIIGEGSFHFQTDAIAARVRAKMPHPLRMVARLVFMSGINGVVYQEIVSRNQMPIVLTRRGGSR